MYLLLQGFLRGLKANGLVTTQTNGGGNTPNGNANGVPKTTTTRSGNYVPGQNGRKLLEVSTLGTGLSLSCCSTERAGPAHYIGWKVAVLPGLLPRLPGQALIQT